MLSSEEKLTADGSELWGREKVEGVEAISGAEADFFCARKSGVPILAERGTA